MVKLGNMSIGFSKFLFQELKTIKTTNLRPKGEKLRENNILQWRKDELYYE